MKNILHIIKKEFLQFKRDKKMFLIILFAPIMQLILLGYAVNLDVNNVKLGIFCQDRGKFVSDFIHNLNCSNYFQVKFTCNNVSECEKAIEKSQVDAIIFLNHNFEKNIINNKYNELQVIFDASNGNKASIASGYLLGAISTYYQKYLKNLFKKKGILTKETNDISIRVWYNPMLKSRIFMLPGIIALLLMVITLLLTSLAIVKEREIGTLEQIIVSPIKPIELLIGKIAPFTILGIIFSSIILLTMYLVFGIVVRGSIFLLFASTLVFIVSCLGLGLFISNISKTQQQAMMISIFAFMLPMIYFSGFAFPVENMPKLIQYLSYLLPLKYFISIIRGIILKGLVFKEIYSDFFIMLFLSLLIFVFSMLSFKKKLD